MVSIFERMEKGKSAFQQDKSQLISKKDKDGAANFVQGSQLLLEKDNDQIRNYPINIINSFQGRQPSRISMLLGTIPKIGNTIPK